MINKFFKNEKLIKIPKKHEAKLEVFEFFHSKFEYNKEYSEKDVNEILKEYFDDYAVLRRYLVDFKYLKRDKNGKIYEKM
ncbi:DUF2087 domain-containing protein [Streptobacillus notomytis]|uniref:DUF2087 domain-containing protein n=1 Tax=Streptobacillus notomytis TaxID=1712031 RepID=UPI00082FF59E|nr:DUF2087 domain-containing protein [Streptobacillus notomytis]